jgi:imidazole glycerol-phosphate synthase subunit HisH
VIVIVDYGMGNLGSIANMLKKIGAEACISSDPDEIGKANKLILPGVGAFDNGMKCLEEGGLLPVLNEKVLTNGAPVLGICLGAQLLARRSEEGTRSGLGWLAVDVRRFNFGTETPGLRIPHMGWNTIEVRQLSPLFENMYEEPRFYFVHSYHLCCDDPEDVAATADYGYEFTAAVQRGNIMGTQFHPEKSHKFGMRLLENFAGLA